MLKSLTEEQDHDMVTVANNVPFVDVDAKVEVTGEDKVYTNSLITVRAKLTRMNWPQV